MAERGVCAENKGNEAGRGGRVNMKGAPISGSEELLNYFKKKRHICEKNRSSGNEDGLYERRMVAGGHFNSPDRR